MSQFEVDKISSQIDFLLRIVTTRRFIGIYNPSQFRPI